MAEARMAVHPVPGIGLHQFRVDPSLHTVQAAITADGMVFFIPSPQFLWRNFVRTIYDTRNTIQTLIWPMSGKCYTALVAGFVTWVEASNRSSWIRSGWIADWVWSLDSKLPLTHKLPIPVRVGYLAFAWGVCLTLGVCVIQRTVLQGLLCYTGWMWEGRKPSFTTKLWGFLVKYLYIKRGVLAGKPLLYAYQGALPSLPLPEIKNTVEGWLSSVQPLLSEEEFQKRKSDADSFLENEGQNLQWYLKLRQMVSRNYISDWWARFVYLRGRGSIFINSNFYIMENAAEKEEDIYTRRQLSRAAVMLYHWCLVRRMIDHERLPPLLLQNLVPICMDQYSRAFNCNREPGKDEDTIRTWPMDESKHVIVTYKGQMYAVSPFAKDNDDLLPPAQLEMLLEGILETGKSGDPEDPSKHMAALTTMGRTEWATLREDHFLMNKHNRTFLDKVERAMFHICLDDRSPKDWVEEARFLFMGNGSNIWCDKSFTCVIFANGRAGIHAEHTWADAPVMAHMWEWILAAELRNRSKLYDKEGRLVEGVSPSRRLRWTDISPENMWRESSAPLESPRTRLRSPQKLIPLVEPELGKAVMAAAVKAREGIADLDLAVTKFSDYGKGAVKAGGVSPDAWVQMALQLAYFRDQGHFDLTYESSMTRMFANGRTETIRSCSMESCAFVRAMEDKSVSDEERLSLLRKAGSSHKERSAKAMLGQGVDRHLFGMYVVSVGKSIDAPFLKDALSMPFRLSTSQVPQRQTDKGTWPDGDLGEKYYSPGGCFGPVADDGYGVCYGIVGENRFLFHVSSKFHASNTSSSRFLEKIFQALRDMRKLVPEKK